MINQAVKIPDAPGKWAPMISPLWKPDKSPISPTATEHKMYYTVLYPKE